VDTALVPGQACEFPRGDERWRLSPRWGGSLVRKDDERDLADVIGTERAAGFVAAALAVRPSGGAVWVDSQGTATTQIDGRQIYLGHLPGNDRHPGVALTMRRVPQSTSAPDAIPDARSPVGSLSEVDGWPPGSVRYVLRRRDVTDPTADRSLSEYLGPDGAAEEARRLLVHRPSGGRIYVAPDGRVVTRVDGRFLVIGKIRRDRWFP
jgi:hypothetical protein